jgi:hypothetical protein
MKPSPYFWLVAFILLANAWLYHSMSIWIASDEAPGFGQSILTWFAAIPQFPSLLLSKRIADSFDLSDAGWSAVTSIVSILIYFPLLYLMRRSWERARGVTRP